MTLEASSYGSGGGRQRPAKNISFIIATVCGLGVERVPISPNPIGPACLPATKTDMLVELVLGRNEGDSDPEGVDNIRRFFAGACYDGMFLFEGEVRYEVQCTVLHDGVRRRGCYSIYRSLPSLPSHDASEW
jgi:hypothetical protein